MIFKRLVGIPNVALLVRPMVHELRQIVKGLKNKKAVGNDGIPSAGL